MKYKKNLKQLSVVFAILMFSLFINKTEAQGPTAPEAVGFEPVDATDMVNLTNGNLSYVLPLLDVEGFPINLSYHAGITPNLEASWVGLGWYLNPGAINRAANGTPDDWKEGVGITFTSFDDTQEYYSITASVGITGTPVSVGVGAHWGGGQGLSGSIQANLGIAQLYADTRGNVAGGVGLMGLGASFSNNSKPNYSISGGSSFRLSDDETGSIGFSDGGANASYSGAKGSVGMSFSGGGNFSIGGANAKGVGGSFSSSSSSDSQGDATIDTKSIGMSISIPIGPISVSLGFKKTKVRVSILKGYENREWGALYASDYTDFTDDVNGDREALIERSAFSSSIDGFTDYMYRGNKLDTYSTRLPQTEEEFVGDYSKVIENINFTFVAYDDYSVSAQGMMGSLTPHVFQNANIIGKGTRTENEVGDPIHAFWHHGDPLENVERTLANSSKPFEFYFNGQFTQTEKNDANVYDATNLSNLNMNNLLTEGSHSGAATGSNRAHQGNYVEVYTNNEIANNQALGLITPKGIQNTWRDDTAYFDPNGIGAYKITAADGKTYHFTLPVYHYEKISRSQLEEQEYQTDIYQNGQLIKEAYDCENVNESRQFTRYATHWLLTAITGPDYVDANSNGELDKIDYGYWIELEYGKWSDGFVWRSPYQDFVYDYNTNVLDNIEEEDKGNYQFGRKQVYYLDRINSKNRTALFVKDIRYDGIGKYLTYKFLNQNNGYANNIGHTGNGQNQNSLNYTNPNLHVKENGVTYAREYSLKLDKIILVDTDDADLVNETGVSNLGSSYPNYTANTSVPLSWSSPYFQVHYGSNYSYDIHQESNVLDVGDLPSNYIQNHAIKVIEFDHDYALVEDSPSSNIEGNTYGGNTNSGKLTLNSVSTLGRGGAQFMPPTKFEYYNSSSVTNPNALSAFLPVANLTKEDIKTHVENRRNFVDAWGHMQGDYLDNNSGQTRSRVDLWSLKEITTPTGGTITVDYEEDDYFTEAFARRYWENGLQFTIDNLTSSTVDITIKKNSEEPLLEDFDFRDYFNATAPAFFDLWLIVWDRDAFVDTDKETIDILKQGLIPYSVSQYELVFRVSRSYITELDDVGDLIPHTFRKTSGNGSEHDPCITYRGDWGGVKPRVIKTDLI